MEPVKLKLRHPVTFDGETITELTIRPLNGKTLRGLQRKPEYEIDFSLKLLGRLTGQPDPVIDELQGTDLAEALAIANGFFEISQGTGSAA